MLKLLATISIAPGSAALAADAPLRIAATRRLPKYPPLGFYECLLLRALVVSFVGWMGGWMVETNLHHSAEWRNP